VTKKHKYLTGTYHAKTQKANINTPHVSDYAETMDQFSAPLPPFSNLKHANRNETIFSSHFYAFYWEDLLFLMLLSPCLQHYPLSAVKIE
jgi:hypothetical protein